MCNCSNPAFFQSSSPPILPSSNPLSSGYVYNFFALRWTLPAPGVKNHLQQSVQGITVIKPDPRIFDDLTRVAGGAMNVFSALREQITSDIKARVEEMAARMDLVPREDFERLEAQVKELQRRLDGDKPAKKPAAKKTTKKPGKKKK